MDLPCFHRFGIGCFDRTHDESGALCCSRMCGDEGVHITSVPMWLFHKFSLSAFCVCFVFCQQPSQIGPPLHPLHGFCMVFSCFRSCLSGDVRHWSWPFFIFLRASEGDVRQFFGGWFLDRLGLNPAGVGLFRLRAERRPKLPPKLPLQLHPQLHPLHGFCMVFSCFRSCLSGDVRHWRWPFFIFLVGVRRRR